MCHISEILQFKLNVYTVTEKLRFNYHRKILPSYTTFSPKSFPFLLQTLTIIETTKTEIGVEFLGQSAVNPTTELPKSCREVGVAEKR